MMRLTLFFGLLGVCLATVEINHGHSFSSPFQANSLKYWKQSPHVHTDRNALRLTPSHKTGSVWNVVRSLMVSWEATMEVAVSVDLRDDIPVRGEGLAFWYVERPGLLGPVYGSADLWTGLGVFVTAIRDSSGQSSVVITGVVNDGTQHYGGVASAEGYSNGRSTESEVGHCVRKMSKGAKFQLSVQYEDQQLKVSVNGRNGDVGSSCFVASDVNLGVDKFFGMSAHASSPGDQHDVLSVLTRDLAADRKPTEEELKRIRAAYAQSTQQQHQRPNHHLEQEEFRIATFNLLSQIQDTQILQQEDTEFMLDLMLNHTRDMGVLRMIADSLQKQQKHTLAEVRASHHARASHEQDVRRNHELLADVADAIHDFSRQMGRRGSGAGESSSAQISFWLVLCGASAFLMGAGYRLYQHRKKKMEVAQAKRFV